LCSKIKYLRSTLRVGRGIIRHGVLEVSLAAYTAFKRGQNVRHTGKHASSIHRKPSEIGHYY